MFHKIRITVVSLVVMLICILSSATTLSYFTDTDTKMNNFIVGNASTTLAIYNNEAGDEEHVFNASDYTLEDNTNIPFYLQAKNDGNIPVYQRFRVVIPIDLSGVITLNLPTMDENCVISTSSENTCKNTDYTVTYKPSVNVEEVPTYAEYYIVSNNALSINSETAEWPTTGLHINDLSNVDQSLLECSTGDNNCILGVNVYSDAIQTAGFTSATNAFSDLAENY